MVGKKEFVSCVKEAGRLLQKHSKKKESDNVSHELIQGASGIYERMFNPRKMISDKDLISGFISYVNKSTGGKMDVGIYKLLNMYIPAYINNLKDNENVY